MKDVVRTVSCPYLPLDGGELLDEEATMLTIGWAATSCISYEPTPLGGVQSVADVVTYRPPTF